MRVEKKCLQTHFALKGLDFPKDKEWPHSKAHRILMISLNLLLPFYYCYCLWQGGGNIFSEFNVWIWTWCLPYFQSTWNWLILFFRNGTCLSGKLFITVHAILLGVFSLEPNKEFGHMHFLIVSFPANATSHSRQLQLYQTSDCAWFSSESALGLTACLLTCTNEVSFNQTHPGEEQPFQLDTNFFLHPWLSCHYQLPCEFCQSVGAGNAVMYVENRLTFL